MGWGEKNNPTSLWYRKRVGKEKMILSTQTTDKKHVNQVSTPATIRRDEPLVIEINFKNIWRILCQKLKAILSPRPHRLQTNE